MDARWTNGIVSESRIFNNIYTSFGGVDFVGGAVLTLSDSEPCSAARNWTAFTPSPGTSWSHIKLDPSWLDVLKPVAPETVPGSNPQNLSTLEILISESILGSTLDQTVYIRTPQNVANGKQNPFNKTVYLETVIASVIADGLSRHGSAQLFDTSDPFANWTLANYKLSANTDRLLHGGLALQKPVSYKPYWFSFLHSRYEALTTEYM